MHNRLSLDFVACSPTPSDRRHSVRTPSSARLGTPALRSKYDVNSPNRPSRPGIDEGDEAELDAAWAAVAKGITRHADEKPAGIESLVTQVSREEAQQDQTDEVTKPKPKPSDEEDEFDDDLELEALSERPSGCVSCIPWRLSFSRRKSALRPRRNAASVVPKPAKAQDEIEVVREASESTDTEESSFDGSNGLLEPLLPENIGKKCLVLDLDETLVHSSFKFVEDADFVVRILIDKAVHRVYVKKRPGVDQFLEACARLYEVVVFTASLAKYADAVLDVLDPKGLVAHRLFRESCVLSGRIYVKDLSKLGRRMNETIIVDNSRHSFAFQPQNAVPITSWFDDRSDTELMQLQRVLEGPLAEVDDVRTLLDGTKPFSWLCGQGICF